MKIITKTFNEYKIKHSSDGTIISGFGIIFQKADHSNDIIARKAFEDLPKAMKNAFSKDKDALPKIFLPMCYKHNLNKKIGIWLDAQISDYGIYFIGKIDNKYKKIIKKIKDKTIINLSISFSLQDFRYFEKNKVKFREILKATAVELSLVDFPCQPEASLTLPS